MPDRNCDLGERGANRCSRNSTALCPETGQPWLVASVSLSAKIRRGPFTICGAPYPLRERGQPCPPSVAFGLVLAGPVSIQVCGLVLFGARSSWQNAAGLHIVEFFIAPMHRCVQRHRLIFSRHCAHQPHNVTEFRHRLKPGAAHAVLFTGRSERI